MTKFEIGDDEYTEEVNTSYDEDQPIGDEPQAYYAIGAEPIDAQTGDDFLDQTYGDPPLPANEEDKKPMNADNTSKITKIGKNQTLIEPANEIVGKGKCAYCDEYTTDTADWLAHMEDKHPAELEKEDVDFGDESLNKDGTGVSRASLYI